MEHLHNIYVILRNSNYHKAVSIWTELLMDDSDNWNVL